jgi:hypothetical protein
MYITYVIYIQQQAMSTWKGFGIANAATRQQIASASAYVPCAAAFMTCLGLPSEHASDQLHILVL